MKSVVVAVPSLLAVAASAAAQETPLDEPPPPVQLSMTLAGGALAPVGAMRDGYQEGVVAGARIGVRLPIGFGVQLAADYSPLPRKMAMRQVVETAYGTIALLPSWSFGRGLVRLHVGAGGGVALERVKVTPGMGMGEVMTHSGAEAAAIAQAAVDVHIASGGGVVLLTGATRTLGERDYFYAWAMAGLSLEF